MSYCPFPALIVYYVLFKPYLIFLLVIKNQKQTSKNNTYIFGKTSILLSETKK